jgi:hypothetical protein
MFDIDLNTIAEMLEEVDESRSVPRGLLQYVNRIADEYEEFKHRVKEAAEIERRLEEFDRIIGRHTRERIRVPVVPVKGVTGTVKMCR